LFPIIHKGYAWFQRELLASKLHHIGRSFLKDSSLSDDVKPVDAVQWLQRAFSVADQLEDTTTSGMAELKVGGNIDFENSG